MSPDTHSYGLYMISVQYIFLKVTVCFSYLDFFKIGKKTPIIPDYLHTACVWSYVCRVHADEADVSRIKYDLLVLRDVSVELPFILMHPKPVEPPASRPQSGDFTLRHPIRRAQSLLHTNTPSAVSIFVSVSCSRFPQRPAVSMETTGWHTNAFVCVCVCVLQLSQRWILPSTPIW